MKEHDLWVKNHIFPLFSEGKDLEIRTRNHFVDRIKVGDILYINRRIKKVIVEIRYYSDFDTMLNFEKLERIYPNHSELELRNGFTKVFTARQQQSGVVVFELRSSE